MIRLALQLWSDLQRRSGARIAIGVVIGVLGMALGVLLQSSFKRTSDIKIAAIKLTDHAGWVRVGHLVYKVLSSRLQRVVDDKDPDETRFIAHISVSIADVQGVSDYIDNETFRLLVDGDPISHSNNVNVTVYEKSTSQVELIFKLSDEISDAELLVGRPSEGMARIPLELRPRRVAGGS